MDICHSLDMYDTTRLSPSLWGRGGKGEWTGLDSSTADFAASGPLVLSLKRDTAQAAARLFGVD